jgi:TPR repeat protein
MDQTLSNEELDEWVWQQLADSEHPDDLICFVIHSQYRESPVEKALCRAVELRRSVDSPRRAPEVLQKIEGLAEKGQLPAILAATRWRYYGLGCDAQVDLAHAWLDRGISLGHTTCLVHKGRMLALQDVQAAIPLFEQAIKAGDIEANAYLAEQGRERYAEQLRVALEAGIPHAQWLEGDRLASQKQSPGSVKAGFELLRRAALGGQTSACVSLGIKYWYGIGTDRDWLAAEQWFAQGLRRGNARCISALGVLLGEQGAERREESIRYLLWGSMLGDDLGQYNLGYELATAGTLIEEKAEGRYWIRKAADQGYLRAIQFIGWGLFDESGSVESPEVAIRLLNRGVRQGDAESQMLLGCAYSRGLGVEHDPTRAHELFHIASLQGHVTATRMLGQTFLNGDGTDVDLGRAIECFKEAAKKKNAQAALELGRLYLFGKGVDKDLARAARWLADAAHWGSTRAKGLLGLMLRHGEGVERNTQAAIRWLREASDEGDASATHALAELTFEGDGVEADEAEGKRLMARAASLGDEDAIAWMREHCPEQPQWLRDMVKGKGIDGPFDNSGAP